MRFSRKACFSLAAIAPFALETPCPVQRPGWWSQTAKAAPEPGQDTPETWEHSVEVQVPFLKAPVLVGLPIVGVLLAGGTLVDPRLPLLDLLPAGALAEQALEGRALRADSGTMISSARLPSASRTG